MPMSNPMNNMSKQTRFHIGYWVAAMIGLLILQYFYVSAQKVASIPYSQFEQLLHDGKMYRGRRFRPLPAGQAQRAAGRQEPSSSPPGSIRNSPPTCRNTA